MNPATVLGRPTSFIDADEVKPVLAEIKPMTRTR